MNDRFLRLMTRIGLIRMYYSNDVALDGWETHAVAWRWRRGKVIHYISISRSRYVPRPAVATKNEVRVLVGVNCDGCPYDVPEDEEDTCHAPKHGAPPTDALCAADYWEARREIDEEEAALP